MSERPFPIPAAILTRHRPPALLVDSLLASEPSTDGQLPASGRIRWLANAATDPLGIVEGAAQSVALAAGYHHRKPGGQPHMGYLAGVRRAEILRCSQSVVSATAHCEQTLGPLALYHVEASDDAGPVASCDLTIGAIDGAPPPPPDGPGTWTQPSGLLSPGSDADPLVTVLETDADTVQARLCCPVEAPFLGGHFPGRPVVPGVILLAAALRAAERSWGAPWAYNRLSALQRIKWTQPVLPEDEVLLNVQQTSADSLQIEARIGETTVAKGRCRFA